MRNKIIRKGSFDAGHRVMFQRFKCANLHGHRYDYEIEFSYGEMLELGYAIDFAELKRIGCAWIDETLDHTFILNPIDVEILELCKNLKSKYFTMHLLDSKGSCNPTVENITKEVFFAMQVLLETGNLKLDRVTLHETERCSSICTGLSSEEIDLFKKDRSYFNQILEFKSRVGGLEYDSRKCT